MGEIKVLLEPEETDPVEGMVNQEIDKFDQWFQQSLGNQPLVRGERAILKTYFAYKLGVAKK